MRSVTALKMLEDGVGVGRLSFGCKLLDECTRGGIPLQGINEIVGEAGAGKTQYALTLSLQCHILKSMGGLGGSTAYLCCGEGTFPVRRLEQLSHGFQTKSGIPYTEFMDSVHIEQCHNADDVLDTLLKKIPNMCSTKGIRLIVIDSIAGMVRTEYDSSSQKDMALRTALLFRVAKELKWLSDIFKVCIVVINQVTASGFQSNEGLSLEGEWGGGGSNPALGLAWTHCLNTRIRLRRDSSNMRSIGQEQQEEDVQEEEGGFVRNTQGSDVLDEGSSLENTRFTSNRAAQYVDTATSSPDQPSASSSGSSRLLTLELSPCNQRASCRYEITNDGVFGIR